MTEQRYAGGGIVRELLEGVAKEAPELTRGVRAATRRATINVGLDINGGEKLSPDEVLAALQSLGVKPVRAAVHQSDTEPTLVIELDRSLNAQEAHKLSMDLRQEAIAQVDENGVGDLHGPMADNWKPFNGDYFLDSDGKRLTQAIMDAGSGEKPGYAGGGIIREAVEGLLEAAGRNADEAANLAKPMRLYHGTKRTNRPDKGFAELSPDVRPSQLGLHLGNQKQADYFASDYQHLDDTDLLLNKDHYARNAPVGGRVIPLDVTVKNPIRLEDRTGGWHPAEIYEQLVEQGKVEYDQKTWDNLYQLQNADSEAARDHAMRSVRRMIEDAGHDGVIYTNRVEGYVTEDPVRQRFKQRGIMDESSLKDDEWLDVVPEARGNDSYIVWNQDQYRSPFGDGPGAAGYAGGGVVRKLGQGLVDMLDFSGVKGKPRTVKIPGYGEHAAAPIAEIDDAAEAYMRKAGIPGTHRIGEYPELDADFSRRIAAQYDALKHAPYDPEVSRTYEALLDETMDQYRALKDTGLDIRFLKDGMDDPYAASPSMGYADMVNNGRLWVFPTSQGYGSGADVFEHPLLTKVGKVGDLEDATANDAFRVVHDAYGHFGPGNPFFRAPGEDRAWMHHARMYSDDALPAMSAETRGQNSWVNYGPKALANKGASGADTIYADQKAVAMPSWVYEKDLGRKPKFAEGGPVGMTDDQLLDAMLEQYQNRDITNYEATRDAVAQQPFDTQSMTHVGAKPRRPVTMETFGHEFDLGDAPYDVAGPMSTMAQTGNEAARLGVYGVPVVGPFIGAGLDTAEAVATDDPTSMAAAVTFGPGGKLVKGAIAGATAYGMDPAEAEAGMFGLLGKWGASREGKAMLQKAEDMAYNKASDEEIVKATGWAFDKDGQPKYELPSVGGGADLSKLRHGLLKEVYYDPNLFDQYPGIENTRVRRIRDLEGAYYSPSDGYIGVGDISSPFYQTYDVGGAKGVLDHELYHLKAQMERWAQGTNKRQAHVDVINDMKNYLKLKDAESQNIGGYINNLKPEQQTGLGALRYVTDIGEVLARREARRRDFMDADIIAKPAPSDLDVPSDAIFYKGYNRPNTYANAIEWNNKLRREGKGLP